MENKRKRIRNNGNIYCQSESFGEKVDHARLYSLLCQIYAALVPDLCCIVTGGSVESVGGVFILMSVQLVS